MIFYNMRYRGPYEYDKFILNIFQYCNLVNDFKNDLNNTTSSWKTLYDLYNEVNLIFEDISKEKGFSESIYKTFIMNGDD